MFEERTWIQAVSKRICWIALWGDRTINVVYLNRNVWRQVYRNAFAPICCSLLACCALSAPVSLAEGAKVGGIVGAALSNGSECPPSDLLLHNARVYTPVNADVDDTSLARYEAVAIKRGKFVFVGSDAASRRWKCGAAKVINLQGSAVYPGFTDSHQHLEGVGRRTKTLSLFGAATLEETVSKIRRWSQGIAEGDWVMGRGWIEREWQDEQRFLTRWDVDAFTESKPLFMPRADGVSALVNSKALSLAGITRDTPDPQGGRFERDAEGELTGYVLGRAMDPFRAILPAETNAYIKDNLLRGMRGICSHTS